jgi:hypothetical protein
VEIEAGWYPDPWKQATFRGWDGARWTDQVGVAGRSWASPVPQFPPKRRVAACLSCRRFVALRELSWLGIGAALATLLAVGLTMTAFHIRIPLIPYLLALPVGWAVASRDPRRWRCSACNADLDRGVPFGTLPATTPNPPRAG